jgi:hypothetical protein
MFCVCVYTFKCLCQAVAMSDIMISVGKKQYFDSDLLGCDSLFCRTPKMEVLFSSETAITIF